ncbi:MAG: trypsin-like serine protease [Verrucomicrobiota bacterium JB025]|nr:trypsin-like peptidase domain-containing protein [Verrucomicrobiota bacterium JB025]
MAVLVSSSGSATYQTTDPSGDQGWSSVGTANGASAVYLGDGWVISAAHVGAGTFNLDSYSFSYVADTAVHLLNPDNTSETSDLVLYQIEGEGLDSLTPASLTSATIIFPNQSVTMIGYGGGTKSWGENTVEPLPYELELNGYVTQSRYTDYDAAIDGQAQAIGGDSGGGVFTYNNLSGEWELIGIMLAISDADESGGTSNGDLTLFANLIEYRDQIDEIMSTPEPSTTLLLGLSMLMVLRRKRC